MFFVKAYLKNMLIKPNNQEKCINSNRFNLNRDINVEFDFRNYKSLKEIFK